MMAKCVYRHSSSEMRKKKIFLCEMTRDENEIKKKEK